MRNDHSIAGTTILQTTLEDADNTQFLLMVRQQVFTGISPPLFKIAMPATLTGSSLFTFADKGEGRNVKKKLFLGFCFLPDRPKI